MTDQHPADLLDAAAQTLRDHATAAAEQGGPTWTYTEPTSGGARVRSADGTRIAGGGVAGKRLLAGIPAVHGQWIATMDPALGLLIAAWLDQAAEALVGQDVPDDEPALAVARHILTAPVDHPKPAPVSQDDQ